MKQYFFTIITLLIFTWGDAQEGNRWPQEEKQLRQAFDVFLKEFKNLDAPKLMETISANENASLLIQGQLYSGKNVRGYFTGAVNYVQSFDSLDVRHIKVDMMSPATGTLTCTYTEWYTPKGQKQMIADGIATYVFVLEEDRKWRIRHCAGFVTIRP